MYETKGGRVKGTILFFAGAIVYLIFTALMVRGFGLQDVGWARFLLTIPQEIIFAVGGVKLLKTAEQTIGKVIGVIFILIAVAELIASIFINLGQYF